MNRTSEQSNTPTFNDDDWKAIFGTEDEADDKESSENSEKPKQNNGSNLLADSVSTVNNSEIPPANPWR